MFKTDSGVQNNRFNLFFVCCEFTRLFCTEESTLILNFGMVNSINRYLRLKTLTFVINGIFPHFY